jgi:uncharacterized Tic20 family protein
MTEATPAPAPAGPLSEAEDKQWAGLAHLLGILGILPSLIIFLVFKDRGAKTRVESKEALNWQITVLAVDIVLLIISAIIGAIATGLSFNYETLGIAAVVGLLAGLFYFLIFVVGAINIIFSIIGFTKVNAGGSYRYPFAIRLVK